MKLWNTATCRIRRLKKTVDEETRALYASLHGKLASTRGQGTTEYAILVGVQASG